MKRFTIAVLLVLLTASPIPEVRAQSGGVCPGIGTVTPLGNGATITVSNTAVGFPAADITVSGRVALVAVGYVATASVRYWDNGETPTDTVGMLVSSGERFIVCGQKAIQNFLMIRTGSDATVTASFYGG